MLNSVTPKNEFFGLFVKLTFSQKPIGYLQGFFWQIVGQRGWFGRGIGDGGGYDNMRMRRREVSFPIIVERAAIQPWSGWTAVNANIADIGKHNSSSQKLTFVYQPSTAAAVTKRTGIAYERRLAIQLSRSVTAIRKMRRVVTSQNRSDDVVDVTHAYDCQL